MGLLSYTLPVEETFFAQEQTPEGMVMTPELVRLNYMHQSPYPQGDIQYMQKGRTLFLWYTAHPLPDTWKIGVPEGYVLAAPYLAGEDLILVDVRGLGVCYLVVVGHALAGQIYFPGHTQRDIADTLALLVREYDLRDREIVTLGKQARRTARLNELRTFAPSLRPSERTWKAALDFCKAPALVVLVVSGAHVVWQEHHARKERQRVEETLRDLAGANRGIRQKIGAFDETASFWRGFAENELRYPSATECVLQIQSVSIQAGVQLQRIHISWPSIQVSGEFTGDTGRYIGALIDTALFSDARLLSSRQMPRSEMHRIQLRLLVRTLNDQEVAAQDAVENNGSLPSDAIQETLLD